MVAGRVSPAARRVGAGVAVVVLLGSLGGCRERPLPITVHTGDWAPYVSPRPDGISTGSGGAYGLAAEVVAAAFREVNYDPIFEFRAWPEVGHLIGERRIEAAFPYSKHPDREGTYCYSAPLGTAEVVLYYNVGQQGSGLDGDRLNTSLVLATVKGSKNPVEIEERFTRLKEFDSELEAFSALARGDIGYVAVVGSVAARILDNKLASKRHLVSAVEGVSSMLAFHLVAPSKGRAGDPNQCDIELLARFNEGLAKLRESGVYDGLVARYGLSERARVHVTLRATERYPLVLAARTKGGDLRSSAVEKIIIPDHTRAVIVEWNPRYTAFEPFDSTDQMENRSRVRLLDGPANNEVVWVPDVFITFDGGDQ